MKSQPWQERRREYLEEKGRLDNVIEMPRRDVNDLLEAPRRVISGEVAVVERPEVSQ